MKKKPRVIDSVIIHHPVIKSVSDDNPKPFYIKSVSKQNIPKKKVTNDFDDSDASIDKTFDSINKNFTHSIDNNILGDS